MKITLITGRQGSGKTNKAKELFNNSLSQIIYIDADRLTDKDSLSGLNINVDNVIIIDEVDSSHLHEIKKLKSSNGIINYRKIYTTQSVEYKISELVIISQQDISKSFRPGSYIHIKL